jgi:signal transduction histidine kinase
MDRATAVAVQVGWLRDSLRGNDGINYRNAQFLVPIRIEVSEVVRELKIASAIDDGDASAEMDLGESAAAHLAAATTHSTEGDDATPSGHPARAEALAAAAELNQLRQSLDAVAKLIPSAARHHATNAVDTLSHRITFTCLLLLIVLLASVVVHTIEYRALVRPLLWLRDDMRRSAAREWREEIRPRGDREFRDVASFFNGLARELADLYRGLEQKVIDRSRELVRSERLASVGFLAAGVAHEINNPLSVISGYAEIAARRLRRVLMGGAAAADDPEAGAEAEAEALAAVLDAQGIIRDEAFRCKEITSRLLSLARGGGDGRQTLRLDDVARQVTVLTRGLRNYHDRRVVLNFDPSLSESLEVIANPTEMKQVLLNLTVNALEAVPPQRGEVRIAGRRAGDWVELSVEDNGKGMTAETLQQVFEPFFTAKRGAGEPGTGLGLSITHAIVENHGGRIRAESGGPGRGSRFTVRLPARVPHVAASN